MTSSISAKTELSPSSFGAPAPEGALAHRWLVVVARSDERHGRARGEQYRRSLARILAAASSIPTTRIFVVVLEHESPWWGAVLAHLPMENVIDEPVDRGTATGSALAVAKINAQDRDAEVLIATLDADPALVASYISADGPVSAEHEGQEYLAWAGEERRFAFCVAPLQTLKRLFREAQPGLLGTMLTTASQAIGPGASLDAVYPYLPAVDLARDVLGLGWAAR
jgi:hypothetical protein